MKTHLNPPTLHSNPAFSQVVVVESPSKTIYVGGQNAVSVDGEIVGTTLAEQTTKTIENVTAALEAAGATWSDVVRLGIHVVQGHDLREGFEAFMQTGVMPDPPPVITGMFVAALAAPGFLVEIDAVAVL